MSSVFKNGGGDVPDAFSQSSNTTANDGVDYTHGNLQKLFQNKNISSSEAEFTKGWMEQVISTIKQLRFSRDSKQDYGLTGTERADRLWRMWHDVKVLIGEQRDRVSGGLDTSLDLDDEEEDEAKKQEDKPNVGSDDENDDLDDDAAAGEGSNGSAYLRFQQQQQQRRRAKRDKMGKDGDDKAITIAAVLERGKREQESLRAAMDSDGRADGDVAKYSRLGQRIAAKKRMDAGTTSSGSGSSSSNSSPSAGASGIVAANALTNEGSNSSLVPTEASSSLTSPYPVSNVSSSSTSSSSSSSFSSSKPSSKPTSSTSTSTSSTAVIPHLAEMSAVWAQAAAKGRGLRSDQFVAFLSALLDAPVDQLDILFQKIDANDDGDLSWYEYLAFLYRELSYHRRFRNAKGAYILQEDDKPAYRTDRYSNSLVKQIVVAPPAGHGGAHRYIFSTQDHNVHVWNARSMQYQATLPLAGLGELAGSFMSSLSSKHFHLSASSTSSRVHDIVREMTRDSTTNPLSSSSLGGGGSAAGDDGGGDAGGSESDDDDEGNTKGSSNNGDASRSSSSSSSSSTSTSSSSYSPFTPAYSCSVPSTVSYPVIGRRGTDIDPSGNYDLVDDYHVDVDSLHRSSRGAGSGSGAGSGGGGGGAGGQDGGSSSGYGDGPSSAGAGGQGQNQGNNNNNSSGVGKDDTLAFDRRQQRFSTVYIRPNYAHLSSSLKRAEMKASKRTMGGLRGHRGGSGGTGGIGLGAGVGGANGSTGQGGAGQGSGAGGAGGGVNGGGSGSGNGSSSSSSSASAQALASLGITGSQRSGSGGGGAGIAGAAYLEGAMLRGATPRDMVIAAARAHVAAYASSDGDARTVRSISNYQPTRQALRAEATKGPRTRWGARIFEDEISSGSASSARADGSLRSINNASAGSSRMQHQQQQHQQRQQQQQHQQQQHQQHQKSSAEMHSNRFSGGRPLGLAHTTMAYWEQGKQIIVAGQDRVMYLFGTTAQNKAYQLTDLFLTASTAKTITCLDNKLIAGDTAGRILIYPLRGSSTGTFANRYRQQQDLLDSLDRDSSGQGSLWSGATPSPVYESAYNRGNQRGKLSVSPLVSISVHNDQCVSKVQYVPHMGLVSCGMDGRIAISSLHKIGQNIRYLGGDSGASTGSSSAAWQHRKGIYAFATTRRFIASAGYENRVLLWDPFVKESIGTLGVKHAHARLVDVIVNEARNQIITVCSDKKIRVFDIRTLQSLHTAVDTYDYTPVDEITAAAFDHHNQRLVTACAKFRLWPCIVAPGNRARSGGPAHGTLIVAVMYSPVFKQIVSVGADGIVRLWYGRPRSVLMIVIAFASAFYACCFYVSLSRVTCLAS